MSDDPKNSRKDAISGRFVSSPADKADQELQTEQSPQKDQTNKTDKTGKTENTEQTNETEQENKGNKSDRPSTKDKTALTMYLDEDTVKQEDYRFQSLNLEHQEVYDRKLQKNADYWPAVFEAAHSDRTVREVLGL